MSWDEKSEDHAVAHHTYERMTLGENDDGYRMFGKGASWQREQLRTDEAVECLARAHHEILLADLRAAGVEGPTWEGLGERERKRNLEEARATITALLGEEPRR